MRKKAKNAVDKDRSCEMCGSLLLPKQLSLNLRCPNDDNHDAIVRAVAARRLRENRHLGDVTIYTGSGDPIPRGKLRRHAVIYCRVAARDDHSLDAQESFGTRYCELHGFRPIEVIRDVGAATKASRDGGMKKLREMLRDGLVDVVVVASMDRLGRNFEGLMELTREIRGAGAFIGLAQ